MTHKIKFKGKTYTVIEYLESCEPTIIKRKARVKSSKGEEFTFVQSILGLGTKVTMKKKIKQTEEVEDMPVTLEEALRG